MSDFGAISAEGATRTLRFERVLDHRREEVWAALTEPEQLGAWLARAEVEPGPTGWITLDFGDGGIERCAIRVWDPPRVLAYDWNFGGETPSHVRFELEPSTDGGTVLTLEHSLLEAGIAPGYGAGWHAHLDQLAGQLEGEVPSWDDRFQAVLETYREAARAVA
jgi:uncharacterized protein YndB with AHSA1/START domain